MTDIHRLTFMDHTYHSYTSVFAGPSAGQEMMGRLMDVEGYVMALAYTWIS